MSFTTTFISPPMSACKYHTAIPDPRCLGCRMAMGAEADSYFASHDFQVQRCYYSQDPPTAPLSPTTSFGESDEESYLLKMRYALQEMDNKVEFVAAKRFLDLGCCPGGFSTYVLSKCPEARGEGVSLPVEMGGHSLAVPSDLRSRFQVHWGDMMRFNHAPEHSGSGKLDGLAEFPVPPNAFDLVLADGHLPPEMAEPHVRNLLLVSQMLAAVRAVKLRGTILIKLSLSFGNQNQDGLMHRLVLALDRLSITPVVALKPRSIYATRGTFYILARDVEAVPRRKMELALETLWVQILEGRTPDKRALDRLASGTETKGRQGWLRELLAPVEGVRREAQRAMTS